MIFAITTTSKDKVKQVKKVEADFLHIDMIPDAMENMGWEMAPKLMRHWFSISPAYSFTGKTKRAALDDDANKLPISQVNADIIKMSWAMKFKQVSTGVEVLMDRWKSTKGVERLKLLLNKKGDYKKEVVEIGYTDDVKELDVTSQINIIPIGSKLDTVNDWYGAMGNSNLKVCVRGKTYVKEVNSFFIVEKIGFYLKDTYDFMDEGKFSEPLGVWSKKCILNKEETAFYMSTYLSGFWGQLAREFSGFVPIFNNDFRRWQSKHDTGGDFIVFSDVMWVIPNSNDKEIAL